MLKVIIIFLLLASYPLFGATAPATTEKNLNQIMSEIGKIMVDTFPVIVAKRELSDKEKQQLKVAIDQLETLFKQAKPFIGEKSSTYQISYDLVLEYLAKTRSSFQINHIDYSRKRLYSLGSICASCHTQDTKLRTLFPGIDRSHFSDDLAFAEFNFITRNYNEAIKYFDQYLRSDQAKTEYDLIVPMQRLITIYVQIFNTSDIAAKQLAEYRNLKSHTAKTRKHLEGWIAGLKTLSESKPETDAKINFEKLEKYVSRYIGDTDQAAAEFFSTPEDEVSRLWLRGRLYHYLNNMPPADQLPVVLYWLSICDRSIGFDYNFSLADLYLKQCIRNYSNHPYAKMCFREYKEFIEISYSGSAGVFIPPELEDELDELKKLLPQHK